MSDFSSRYDGHSRHSISYEVLFAVVYFLLSYSQPSSTLAGHGFLTSVSSIRNPNRNHNYGWRVVITGIRLVYRGTIPITVDRIVIRSESACIRHQNRHTMLPVNRHELEFIKNTTIHLISVNTAIC